MSRHILLIDDDKLLRSFLVAALKGEGCVIEEAATGTEGLEKFLAIDFDLVITDLRMPDMSGLEVIKEGKKTKPFVKWIIITAYGSIENAVEAMKEGAADYLTKPLANPDELRRVVRRAFRELEAEQRISFLSEELGKQFPPMEMLFLGKAMGSIRRLVHDVAPTMATVLISGPSGTGKEVIARVIHKLSQRKDGPFVAVHCAALAESLLESELFGHERGAFTGASSVRKGRFELAEGGTIFLDEIGEISQSVQVSLLRVLQEREIERVGGSRSIPVNIRIISATNKDLREEVSSGHFREDLYYRLNVFPIVIPRLTQRYDAIISLANYFLVKSSESLGKKAIGISEAAQSLLLAYHWPGNIRELQNVMERAVILSRGLIEPDHLNLEMFNATSKTNEGTIRQAEKDLIEKALMETGGNRKKTSEILGISVRTLHYRIKEYGLE